MEIICKYEEKDPDNMPKEGDYLLAMNTLKALNDRKQNFTSYQRQTVVQIRERIRRIPNILEITNRHASWMMKKMKDYVTCGVCGSQLVDEYAMNRHQKRSACRTTKARVFFYSSSFSSKREKWSAKGYLIDFPFVAAMFQLHNDALPRIVILPDVREFQCPQEMIPRRLLPQHFWESMWSHSAQSVNPKFAFRYEPKMFCNKLYRDGPNGYGKLYRHSIMSQAEYININNAEEQLRWATAFLTRTQFMASLPNVPKSWERYGLHYDDHQPLLKMTIAPAKRPRFTCFPAIMNMVAGANPASTILAEDAHFSSVPQPAAAPVIPQVPPPAPDSDQQSADDEADDYNV